MIKISNICLHQNSIFIKLLKILKIHEIFCENPRIIFVLFYDVHKENMFTTNLEDGREALSKARKKGYPRENFWFSYKIFNEYIEVSEKSFDSSMKILVSPRKNEKGIISIKYSNDEDSFYFCLERMFFFV